MRDVVVDRQDNAINRESSKLQRCSLFLDVIVLSVPLPRSEDDGKSS